MHKQYWFLLAGAALLFLAELGVYFNGVNASNWFVLALFIIVGYAAIVWSAVVGTRSYAFVLGVALLVLAAISWLAGVFAGFVVRAFVALLCFAAAAFKENKIEIKISMNKTKRTTSAGKTKARTRKRKTLKTSS